MAAPVIQGTATEALVGGTATDTISIPKPTGLANGEYLVVVINAKGQTVSTVPSGFTLLKSILPGGSYANTYIYYKSITNAGSEPATYDFVISSSVTQWGGSAVRISGGGTWDTTGAATASEASDTSVEWPTVTTPSADCLVFYVAGFSAGRSCATPTGCTQIYDSEELSTVKPSYAHAWFAESYTSAGTTTARSAATSGSTLDSVITIALAPGFSSYTVNLSESIATTEASGRSMVQTRASTESIPTTEATARSTVQARAIANSIPLVSQTVSAFRSFFKTVTESAGTASDTPARVFSGARTVPQTVAGTDTPSRMVVQVRGVTNSAGSASNAVVRAVVAGRTITNSFPTTQAQTRRFIGARTITNSFPTTESLARVFTGHGRVVFSAGGTLQAGARREIRGNTAPPPPGFLEAFMDPTSYIYRRVDIYEEDSTTPFQLNVDFLDGSVSVDLSRAERRTFSLVLDNTESLFDNYPGGFWYDKVVKIYRGLVYRDEIWEVQLGEFLIDTISQEHFPHVVSCNGRDYTKKLMSSKLRAATAYPAGTPMEEVIRTLAANAGITKFILPSTGVTLGKQFTFDRGTTRWDAIHEIVEAYGYEVYFNNQGYMVLREFQDPSFSPNQFVFFTGPGGQIASFSKVSNDTRIYNHIVVAGEAQDQPPVWAEAKNTNPESPTSIDNLRQTRTYEYVSSFITTTEQAQDVADKFLKIHALEAFEINLETIVLPWLDVGNIIEFIDPDPNPGEPNRFLMSSMEIPLALSGMSFNAKRVTIVG